MKTYEAIHVSGNIDWETVPVAPIDTYLWSNVRAITSSAQLCWDENNLYVRLQAVEPNIRREHTGIMDEVCEDSCMEFFFCPRDIDDPYFNFECNPNAAMYIGYDMPGFIRYRLYREDFPQLFQPTITEFDGGWGLELRIPLHFIQNFVPEFSLYRGKKFRANFYKIGEKTEPPHFMSWNPVEHPTPNFHLPEYFGQITLV